jgi:hypothetical protein
MSYPPATICERKNWLDRAKNGNSIKLYFPT